MLKVSEVAERLNVSERTVQRLIKVGELRAIKVGGQLRIDPRDFEEFLQEAILIVDDNNDKDNS